MLLMRLQADVHAEGLTKHLVLDAKSLSIVPVKRPATIEILEEGAGAFLFRLDERGVCLADTWHEDLAAAKAQAAFEFGIAEKDWMSIV